MSQGYPLSIRLDYVAAPISPAEVLRRMQAITDRLGVDTRCDVNGIDVTTAPDVDPSRLIVSYAEAQRMSLPAVVVR